MYANFRMAKPVSTVTVALTKHSSTSVPMEPYGMLLLLLFLLEEDIFCFVGRICLIWFLLGAKMHGLLQYNGMSFRFLGVILLGC